MHRILTTVLVAAISLVATSCSYNYLETPRPMKMYCPGSDDEVTRNAANIFEKNGYRIVEANSEENYLLVQDTVDMELDHQYSDLIRTWRIDREQDTVVINVWSLNVRKDGSDVKQTWSRDYGNEVVKDWMRPIMVGLEAACGLGDPLRPR